MTSADMRELHWAMASSGDDRRRVERSYFRFATTGVEFFVTLAALAFLGMWLDGRFHTSPVLTIVLTLVGFAAATWNLLRSVARLDPPRHDPHDRP